MVPDSCSVNVFISQLRLNFASVTNDLIILVNYVSQDLFLCHVPDPLQVSVNFYVFFISGSRLKNLFSRICWLHGKGQR